MLEVIVLVFLATTLLLAILVAFLTKVSAIKAIRFNCPEESEENALVFLISISLKPNTQLSISALIIIGLSANFSSSLSKKGLGNSLYISCILSSLECLDNSTNGILNGLTSEA